MLVRLLLGLVIADKEKLTFFEATVVVVVDFVAVVVHILVVVVVNVVVIALFVVTDPIELNKC